MLKWRPSWTHRCRCEHEQQSAFATVALEMRCERGDKVGIEVIEQVPTEDEVELDGPIVGQQRLEIG